MDCATMAVSAAPAQPQAPAGAGLFGSQQRRKPIIANNPMEVAEGGVESSNFPAHHCSY